MLQVLFAYTKSLKQHFSNLGFTNCISLAAGTIHDDTISGVEDFGIFFLPRAPTEWLPTWSTIPGIFHHPIKLQIGYKSKDIHTTIIPFLEASTKMRSATKSKQKWHVRYVAMVVAPPCYKQWKDCSNCQLSWVVNSQALWMQLWRRRDLWSWRRDEKNMKKSRDKETEWKVKGSVGICITEMLNPKIYV